jgi:oxygen-independent coproporphyrinogen-3 oxidase
LDKDKVNNIIKYARENGFNNINLDLMYAIPSEDIEILKEDLEYIVSLDVEHISTYSLIIEEHTKLSIKNTSNISEDLDYEMYKVICEYLKKNNYEHYEISNFSKEGYYSKHNNCYWENKRYFGFGLGASSYIDNKRINNTRSINKYLDGKYRSDIEVLDDKAMMEYEVILNLRKSNGIDFDLFKQKYEIDLNNVYKYDKLVDMGLLLLKDNCLLIPEDKWYISNEIIVKMLESDENG